VDLEDRTDPDDPCVVQLTADVVKPVHARVKATWWPATGLALRQDSRLAPHPPQFGKKKLDRAGGDSLVEPEGAPHAPASPTLLARRQQRGHTQGTCGFKEEEE
jgi:hypothetical protein